MDLTKRKEDILEELKKENPTKIILVGKAGIGKTWMAREICESATRDGIVCASLWVSPNIDDDSRSLWGSIAQQLSVLSTTTTEEWEEDDDDKEEETLESLKQRILAKLKEIQEKKRSSANSRLLLVLDDEGKKMNEEEIFSKLASVLHVEQKNLLKILISRKGIDVSLNTNDIGAAIKVINMESLKEDESLTLLKKRVKKEVLDSPAFGQSADAIAKKSMGFPAAIILIAEALNRIKQCDSGRWTIESALEEAANYEDAGIDTSPLLRCAYDLLPRCHIVSDCFWHCREFFHKYGAKHYNELITHWIMEGYLGPNNHVEKAYEEGHRILMEFIGRGIIKVKEDNIVTMEGATWSMIDRRRSGFGGTAYLGLTRVIENGREKGLGGVAQTDGMIKTLSSDKKWAEVSTLLIDGSRLSREVPDEFFKLMSGLEVLALFDPRFESLPLSLSELDKLVVLVLRGGDLLHSIDDISNLKALTVLEISGAISLDGIPDDLFEQLTQLQSLNFSGTNVETLPSTISKLSELRLLILRQCAKLKYLPKINTLKHLEVLDLSGATSFTKFQEKSFAMLYKLQTLDLSQTQIERLPFVSKLKDLTHLLLRGCENLTRLPMLEQLPCLQVLDLSYAVNLREINNDSLENNDNLKILDLSGTAIDHLPSNIRDVSELYLRGCPVLKELPCIECFRDLELLDLSDSSSLVKINDESFKHLHYLRCINLSKTKVTNLPSLSNLCNLRCLLLRDCSCLEELPEVEGLIRLEELDLSGCVHLRKLPHLNGLHKLQVLDLSGCTELSEIPDQSFEHMSCLQKLNLSETKVERLSCLRSTSLCDLVLRNCINLQCLPSSQFLSKLEVLDLHGATSLSEVGTDLLESMTNLQVLNLSKITLNGFAFLSKLTNIRQLSLNCCPGLETEPCLEALTRLKVLDLSGTAVPSLSSVKNLNSLHKLLLQNCSKLVKLPSLELLTHLEVLDLSGSGIEVFPYEISELPCLKHLDLRDTKITQAVDLGRIKHLPEELNGVQLSVSKPAEIHVDGRKTPILVNGTKIFQILNENHQLLEACLDQNFFCVCPPKQQANGNMHRHRDKVVFNDVYFEVRQFPHNMSRSMELCGFKDFPSGMESVLEQAEYISLVENRFMKGLSSLGSGTLKLKGCWLERCSEMKNIFCDGTDANLGANLQILWVSNLLNLKSLCNEIESMNFENLQYLYLDCCPTLENVFPSTPQLGKLKILSVKFCDNLKTIFKCKGTHKCRLPKLQELHLLELPELTSIGAQLPPEALFTHIACPNLKDSEF